MEKTKSSIFAIRVNIKKLKINSDLFYLYKLVKVWVGEPMEGKTAWRGQQLQLTSLAHTFCTSCTIWHYEMWNKRVQLHDTTICPFTPVRPWESGYAYHLNQISWSQSQPSSEDGSTDSLLLACLHFLLPLQTSLHQTSIPAFIFMLCLYLPSSAFSWRHMEGRPNTVYKFCSFQFSSVHLWQWKHCAKSKMI